MDQGATVRHVVLVVGYDDGEVRPHLGIEFEGGVWLVTAWLVDPPTGEATPERMIRVDTLSGIAKAPPGGRFDYANVLLPRAVIEGRTQQTPGFEVRSLPERPRVHRRDLKTLPDLFPRA